MVSRRRGARGGGGRRRQRAGRAPARPPSSPSLSLNLFCQPRPPRPVPAPPPPACTSPATLSARAARARGPGRRAAARRRPAWRPGRPVWPLEEAGGGGGTERARAATPAWAIGVHHGRGRAGPGAAARRQRTPHASPDRHPTPNRHPSPRACGRRDAARVAHPVGVLVRRGGGGGGRAGGARHWGSGRRGRRVQRECRARRTLSPPSDEAVHDPAPAVPRQRARVGARCGGCGVERKADAAPGAAPTPPPTPPFSSARPPIVRHARQRSSAPASSSPTPCSPTTPPLPQRSRGRSRARARTR